MVRIMEVGNVSLVAELDTRQVEQQIEQFKKRLETIKLDVPVTSIGKAMKHYKAINNTTISPKVNHKPLTDLNKHLDLKVSHVKKVNAYLRANPLKVKYQEKTVKAQLTRSSSLESTSSFSSSEFKEVKVGLNEIVKILTVIKDSFLVTQKQSIDGHSERKKQSTKLSHIVKNTKNTFFRNIARGFQEGIGATYARQGATSFLKGLKYEERLGLVFETFGEQVSKLGEKIGNVGFEAIFGMNGTEFIEHIKDGINEISTFIDTEVVENLNNQIDKEIVILTKNLLSAFTKGKDIPKNLKQIINLFSQVRDEAIKGVQKRKTNKAKEQADIIKQQPIPKYQYDPEKEKTVIVSGGFAGSGGDAAKDIVGLINQMYKGNADIQKIITNFTDVKTANHENVPIWAMNALARIVDQSVGLGFNPDSLDMVMKVLASKEANPERPVELVGYSAGGYVVNEAMAILKELGITDVKGVGIGTPTDIGVSHDLEELNYTAFLGDKDGLQIFRKILGAINLLNKNQEAQTVPDVVGHNFEAYGATPEVQSKIGDDSDYTERQQLDIVRLNPSRLLSSIEETLTSMIGSMQTASLSYQQYLVVAMQSLLPVIEEATADFTKLFLNSSDKDVQAESLKSLNFLADTKDVISGVKGDKLSNTTLQKFILTMAKGMGVTRIDQPIPSLIPEANYTEGEGLYSARNNTLHLPESLANKLQEGNYEAMSAKEKNVLIHELRHFFQTFLPKQQILGMNNMIKKGIPMSTISQMRIAAESSVSAVEKEQGHSMPPVQREEMIDKEMDAYFFADMYADKLNDFFLQLQQQAENIDFSDFSYSLVPSMENEFYPPLQESIGQVTKTPDNPILQDSLTSVVSTSQESSKEKSKLSAVLKKELKMFLEELKTILSQIKIEVVILNGVESLPDNIVQYPQETSNILSEEIEIPIVSNNFAQELEEISALINNPPTNNLLEQLEKILKTKLNAKGLEQLARLLSLKPATNRADNEKMIAESGRSLAEILQAISSIDDTGKLKEAQTGFIKPEITQEQFDNIALPSIKEQVALIKEGIKNDSSLINLIKQYTLIQEKIKWIRKHNKLFTIKGSQNSEIQGQAESLKYLQSQIKEIAQLQGLDFDFDILDSLQSAKHQFEGGIEEFILLAKQSGIDLGDNFLKAVDKVMGISSPSKKMKGTAKWIVQGLKTGIIANLSTVKDSASLIPSTILEIVDEGLGIKSPAKEIIERGLNIVQTLANTISSGINVIEPAVAKVSDSIKDGLSSIGSEIKDVSLKEKLSSIFDDFVNQTPLLKNNIEKITGLFKQLYGAFGSGMVFKGLVTLFNKITDGAFDAAVQVETLARQLAFATGKNGFAELQRIKKETDAIGISFLQAAEGLRQFSASTIGTSLNENAGQIVGQFQKSFAALGLSNEQQEGAFVALSQMASKGVVSMEELRQQLAERLPGAVNAAARSMGMTTVEFLKMVESGQVLAEDLLPALATQLENESALGLATSAKSTQAELTRLENNIFSIQAGIGQIQLVLAKLGLPVLNSILKAITTNVVELTVVLIATAVVSAIALVSALKSVAGVSFLVSKAMALTTLAVKAFFASMLPLWPYVVAVTALTVVIKQLYNYFNAGSKEIKEYSKQMENLSKAMDAIKKKEKPDPNKIIPKMDNDFKNWDVDDYGWSGWKQGSRDFIKATREEFSEFWDFVTNRSSKAAKAFNANVENLGKSNQSAIDIYQTAQGNNDIDLGNGITVKDDYSTQSLTAIQDRLQELRTLQQNIKLQMAVASDQGNAKFLEELNKSKGEVEKEIQRVTKESFLDSAIIAQGIQAQEANIEQIKALQLELQVNKENYSDKDYNARQNTLNTLLTESERILGDLNKREEQRQNTIKEQTDLYTKQIASIRILQQEIANIDYTAGLKGIDGQIAVLTQKLTKNTPDYLFDKQMRQVRTIEINTKLKVSAQAFSEYENDVVKSLGKISAESKQSIADFLGIDDLDSAILNKQISPETLAQLKGDKVPVALKEAIEQEADINALVEKGQEYLKTWQQIKQQQLESVNLIKEEQDALKQRIEDLRGFKRSLEDLDTATKDFLTTNTRAKEDIDVAVRDFKLQKVRGLEDFARQLEDASIQYQRQQRDLIESYQDLSRQLVLQTFQIRKTIDETTRDIQRRSALNAMRQNLDLGGQGLFSAVFDAIDQFITSQNELKTEELTIEEQRLQIQEDVISLAKQIRGMQEQIFDMERQRLLQIRDLMRQQVDLINGQLDAQRNITRQLADFVKDNKERLRAITRQFEDMELQARSMGIKFDDVMKAFKGINTNYNSLNGAISNLISSVNQMRNNTQKELASSRANPNIPQTSSTSKASSTSSNKPKATPTTPLNKPVARKPLTVQPQSASTALELLNNIPLRNIDSTNKQRAISTDLVKLVAQGIKDGLIIIRANEKGEIKSIEAKTAQLANILGTGNANSGKYDKGQTFVYNSKQNAQLGTVLNNLSTWLSRSSLSFEDVLKPRSQTNKNPYGGTNAPNTNPYGGYNAPNPYPYGNHNRNTRNPYSDRSSNDLVEQIYSAIEDGFNAVAMNSIDIENEVIIASSEMGGLNLSEMTTEKQQKLNSNFAYFNTIATAIENGFNSVARNGFEIENNALIASTGFSGIGGEMIAGRQQQSPNTRTNKSNLERGFEKWWNSSFEQMGGLLDTFGKILRGSQEGFDTLKKHFSKQKDIKAGLEAQLSTKKAELDNITDRLDKIINSPTPKSAGQQAKIDSLKAKLQARRTVLTAEIASTTDELTRLTVATQKTVKIINNLEKAGIAIDVGLQGAKATKGLIGISKLNENSRAEDYANSYGDLIGGLSGAIVAGFADVIKTRAELGPIAVTAGFGLDMVGTDSVSAVGDFVGALIGLTDYYNRTGKWNEGKALIGNQFKDSSAAMKQLWQMATANPTVLLSLVNQLVKRVPLLGELYQGITRQNKQAETRKEATVAIGISDIPMQIFPAEVQVPDVSPIMNNIQNGVVTDEKQLQEILQLQDSTMESINFKKLEQQGYNLTILKLEDLALKKVQLSLKATDQQRQSADALANALRQQVDLLRQMLETYRGLENESMKLSMNAKGYLLTEEQRFLALFDVQEKYRSQIRAVADFKRDIDVQVETSDPEQIREIAMTQLEGLMKSSAFKDLPEEAKAQFNGLFRDLISGAVDGTKALMALSPLLDKTLNDLIKAQKIEEAFTKFTVDLDIEIEANNKASSIANDLAEGYEIFDKQKAVGLRIMVKEMEVFNKHLERRKTIDADIARSEAIINNPESTAKEIAFAKRLLAIRQDELANEVAITQAIIARSAREIQKARDDEKRGNEISINRTIGDKQREINPFGGGSARQAEAERLDIAQRYADEMERIKKMEESGDYSQTFIANLRRDIEAIRDYDLSKVEEKFNIFAQAIREPMQQAFTSLFGDVVRGTKSIGDVFNEFLNQIANFFANIAAQIATSQVMGFFKNLGMLGIGGIAGGAGTTATGAVGALGSDFIGSVTNSIASGVTIPTFNDGGEVNNPLSRDKRMFKLPRFRMGSGNVRNISIFKNGGAISHISHFNQGGTVENNSIPTFNDGGIVNNSIPTFNNGGLVNTSMINNSLNSMMKSYDMGLVQGIYKAMQKEGTGAMPIVVHAGEQVLTDNNWDAQAFRHLQQTGKWDEIKQSIRYQGDIGNFDMGGTVGNMTINSSLRSPQRKPQGTVYNYAINVTTKDANSFRKSQSLIAQEQKMLQERRQRFN